MKTKIMICASLAIMLAACGKGGGGSAANEYIVPAKYPERLAAASGDLKALAMLMLGESVISSPAQGTIGEGVWNFSIEPLAELPESGVSLKVDFSESKTDLLLASIMIPLESLASETLFDISASEFDFSFDDDSDGLCNIDERVADTDPHKSDTDGDERTDGKDAFPLNVDEWSDIDSDGIGDNSDEDIDGDGLSNDDESIIGSDPLIADTDGDGFDDSLDNCPTSKNKAQSDTDGDGRGDSCDNDSDGDGLSDIDEERLGTNKLLADTDGDGLGDKTETAQGSDPLKKDTDSDGTGDKNDNCPVNANPNQSDLDRDGLGDLCDSDRDNDGIQNQDDFCPDAADPLQEDRDADGFGDLCDPDIDGDDVLNENDNCPYVANPAQSAVDADNDKVPVDCDLDDTDSGVKDEAGAIFVDASFGSDSAPGTRMKPLLTLGKAVQRAISQKLPVYVYAGNYDLSGLVIHDGLQLFGGFASADQTGAGEKRKAQDASAKYRTVLTRKDIPVTLSLAAKDLVLDGFYLENKAKSFDPWEPSATVEVKSGSVRIERSEIGGNSDSQSCIALSIKGGDVNLSRSLLKGEGLDAFGSQSIALSISGGSLFAANNIVIAGEGRFATAVLIDGASPMIVNNTIDASSGNSALGTAAGIQFSDSSPVIVNNIVFTSDAKEQLALDCRGPEPTEAMFLGSNIFAQISGTADDAIVRDCNGQAHTDAVFSLGRARIGSNEFYTEEKLSDLINADYSLISKGMDSGLNVGIQEFGSISVDYLGKTRTGAYDLGALEK